MNDDEHGTMNGQETDDKLMRMARGLPTEVQPARDLWPAIAEAIARPAAARVSRWPRFAAQAAAVLLLVGASSALTWLAMQNDSAGLSPVSGQGGLHFEPVSGSFGSAYSLGPDFTDARNSLVSKLDAELERLPPDTRAEVEKNIATIRAAIAEINRALAEEPDNVLLQELLLNTYGEELTVMRKVDGLANSVMRREDI
jgi:hypothetical protein